MQRKATVFILAAVMAAVLGALCFLPSSTTVHALSPRDANVRYQSVDKQIVVSEQKVCSIVETITVEFRYPNINVGLSRNVSRWNRITRIVDGKQVVKKTLSRLTLESVTMDGQEEYHFVEKTTDYYYLNTGADGDYKHGLHVYEFRYAYDLGHDFIGDFDDFTFDIMDYGFRGEVEAFSATVTLPETFDVEKLSFRTNDMAPVREDFTWTVDGNTLTCRSGKLEAEHGLTMQLLLPEGYFDTHYTPTPLYIVAWCSIGVCALGLLLLWLLFCRPRGGIDTAEYYPPEGYSPIDVARVYRGRIRPKDFAALILYWASIGLIDIRRKQEKDFILTRKQAFPTIAETDPTRAEEKKKEKQYFTALFSEQHSRSKAGEFHTDRTKRRKMSERLKACVRALYRVEPPNKGKFIALRIAAHALATLPLLLYVLWGGGIDGNYVGLFIIIFPVIAVNIFLYVPMPLWFKILWCGMFGGAPLSMIVVFYNNVYDVCWLWIVAIAVFCIGNVVARFLRPFDKRKARVLGQIRGFKRFLVTAELDKLEMLVEQSPAYFLDILPFCYVFGITEKMEKKFAALRAPLPKPDCIGSSSYHTFCRGFSHAMHTSTASAYSAGRSGSGGHGGGGGGGGSSGGGGGGGGCGGR